MNVLSLFDGMSCGRIALERAEIKVDTYYSSEIDKFAIQIANKNYPQDKNRLGDVTKWQDWNINWDTIDLVSGGFPCQAWSVAGKQLGDRDERGMLFWTMLDIMKKVLEHNPKAKFLIENVKMKKEFEEYITYHTEQALGTVYKHLINSSLVSAQNRQRYYWTNIEGIEQPEDKGLVLRDILEDLDVNNPITKQSFKQTQLEKLEDGEVAATQLGNSKQFGNAINTSGKAFTLRASNPNGVILRPCEPRGRVMREKSNCLTAANFDYCHWNGYKYRKLTPLECERLQTVPDNYTEGVSNSQRYKMLGNGWTVDVIAHIFKGLKNE